MPKLSQEKVISCTNEFLCDEIDSPGLEYFPFSSFLKAFFLSVFLRYFASYVQTRRLVFYSWAPLAFKPFTFSVHCPESACCHDRYTGTPLGIFRASLLMELLCQRQKGPNTQSCKSHFGKSSKVSIFPPRGYKIFIYYTRCPSFWSRAEYHYLQKIKCSVFTSKCLYLFSYYFPPPLNRWSLKTFFDQPKTQKKNQSGLWKLSKSVKGV